MFVYCAIKHIDLFPLHQPLTGLVNYCLDSHITTRSHDCVTPPPSFDNVCITYDSHGYLMDDGQKHAEPSDIMWRTLLLTSVVRAVYFPGLLHEPFLHGHGHFHLYNHLYQEPPIYLPFVSTLHFTQLMFHYGILTVFLIIIS